jgi:hypothetical protein
LSETKTKTALTATQDVIFQISLQVASQLAPGITGQFGLSATPSTSILFYASQKIQQLMNFCIQGSRFAGGGQVANDESATVGKTSNSCYR